MRTFIVSLARTGPTSVIPPRADLTTPCCRRPCFSRVSLELQSTPQSRLINCVHSSIIAALVCLMWRRVVGSGRVAASVGTMESPEQLQRGLTPVVEYATDHPHRETTTLELSLRCVDTDVANRFRALRASLHSLSDDAFARLLVDILQLKHALRLGPHLLFQCLVFLPASDLQMAAAVCRSWCSVVCNAAGGYLRRVVSRSGVYVCGGVVDAQRTPARTALRLDVCRMAWIESAPATRALDISETIVAGPAAAQNAVVPAAAGGNVGTLLGVPGVRMDAVSPVYEVSITPGSTSSFRPGAPQICRYHAATTVYNRRVYLAGGRIANGARLSTCACYDPLCDTWIPLPDMACVRSGATIVGHSGKLFVFGGFDGTKHVESTECLVLPAAENMTPGGPALTGMTFSDVAWSAEGVAPMPVAVSDVSTASFGPFIYAAGCATSFALREAQPPPGSPQEGPGTPGTEGGAGATTNAGGYVVQRLRVSSGVWEVLVPPAPREFGAPPGVAAVLVPAGGAPALYLSTNGVPSHGGALMQRTLYQTSLGLDRFPLSASPSWAGGPRSWHLFPPSATGDLAADMLADLRSSCDALHAEQHQEGDGNADFAVWHGCQSVPLPRHSAPLAAVAGELYVAGGWWAGQPIGSACKYLPRSDTWCPLPQMPEPRDACRPVGFE